MIKIMWFRNYQLDKIYNLYCSNMFALVGHEEPLLRAAGIDVPTMQPLKMSFTLPVPDKKPDASSIQVLSGPKMQEHVR